MTCPSCGRSNRADARFCDGCGEPVRALAGDRDLGAYTPRHLAEKILTQRPRPTHPPRPRALARL